MTKDAYPSLEELRLIWYPALSESFRFDPILEGKSLPPLRELDLRGAVLQPSFFLTLPPSLETLRLDSGSIERVHYGSPQSFAMGENELPNLKTLIINDAPWATPENLSLFLFHSKAPIRALSVNACLGILSEDIIYLLSDPEGANPELHNITEIGAAGMMGMNDKTAERLWAKLPNLKILDLSQTIITGCTIRMLAHSRDEETGRPKLEKLIISRCENVSRDAIDYGRERGLKIII